MLDGRLWVEAGRIKAWIFRPAVANRRVKAVPTNPVAPVIAIVSTIELFCARSPVTFMPYRIIWKDKPSTVPGALRGYRINFACCSKTLFLYRLNKKF
jgi:hypothetical protein